MNQNLLRTNYDMSGSGSWSRSVEMIKEIIKLWNTNFDKGVTIFQIFLMVMMFFAAVIENQSLVIFSMFNILLGYFEPNQDRFSLKCKYKNDKTYNY